MKLTLKEFIRGNVSQRPTTNVELSDLMAEMLNMEDWGDLDERRKFFMIGKKEDSLRRAISQLATEGELRREFIEMKGSAKIYLCIATSLMMERMGYNILETPVNKEAEQKTLF